MNIEAQNNIILAYLSADEEMLLNGKKIGSGLSFAGGDRRTAEDPLQVAKFAKSNEEDTVHLGFERIDDDYKFVELTLYMPRDEGTYIVSGCRLHAGRQKGRVVILPPAGKKGSYRVAPREILHVRSVPADIEAGVERANTRLNALVRK
ncbi:hypothetical protein [Erythrobacter sp. QSSC1-22B]|uniref:hypothetical protein n=1 Tax=Erythrobacter sp. QSSC1-22B TaxID=1860125 RepID=UPI0011AA642E|nr:hypothetical protein [Erythrobacter sp. QSSC1-22B]